MKIERKLEELLSFEFYLISQPTSHEEPIAWTILKFLHSVL